MAPRLPAYRIEAWDFLIAGGGLYSNLDYSFVAGHEDGTFNIKRVGGGGPTLRRQLNVLRLFMESLPFVRMAPAPEIVKSLTSAGVSVRVLAEPGKAYAVYLHHGRPVKKNEPGAVPYVVDSKVQREELRVALPRNSYLAEWINTKTGDVQKVERFHHEGGAKTLASPGYVEDVALRVLAETGNVALYKALQIGGEGSVIVPITGMYPLVTVVLARFLLKERLSRVQMLGIGVALIAIYLFSPRESLGATVSWKSALSVWMLYSLLALFLFGVACVTMKFATRHISDELSTIFYTVGYIILAIVIIAARSVEWNVSLKNRA